MSNGKDCQCGQAHRACNTEYQYAAKVVCGRMLASPAGAPATPVAPGQYWTAVNIHNPSKCEAARFRWKVTVGNTADPGRPGPVTAYRAVVLEPDRTLELDCRQITSAFPTPPTGLIKGYVVIESDIELDVVAVYSTAQTPTGAINTFHTERVQERCVPVCEDLVLPLHTGLAAWQTVSAPSGPLGPVVNVAPNPGWGPAPFGSLWVSQAVTDSQSAAAGTRDYDLCFDLCFGFTLPRRFNIQVMADDSATVTLNGNAVGSVAGPGFITPTTMTVNTQFLQPGRNCFRVSVLNGITATGFAFAGILRVARGKCPCSPLPLVPFGRVALAAADVGAGEAAEFEASASREVAPREATTKRPAGKAAAKKKTGSKK